MNDQRDRLTDTELVATITQLDGLQPDLYQKVRHLLLRAARPEPVPAWLTVKILATTSGNPPGKLADAELHFQDEDGPLAGLKLIGFAIWERRTGGGRNVTFPARQYSVNGERRSFALLRPVSDVYAQDRVRDAILQAFEAFEHPPEPPTLPPSPLESSADAAGEHSVDACMAESVGAEPPHSYPTAERFNLPPVPPRSPRF